MVLKLQHSLDLPTHALGGFDHGDVFENNGFSFVAHTANATVEMYEGYDGVHLRTITDVPEGSGVICAQAEKKVYAASRATGRII